ncbi:MAG: YdcH family protein [Methylovirgula sp.]
MPMQSHLAELQRRHDALDREITKEWVHPGVDEVRLAELKRRKLQIKDEIVKLMKADCETATLH